MQNSMAKMAAQTGTGPQTADAIPDAIPLSNGQTFEWPHVISIRN